ncbi:MAG: hypothetical protein OEW05_13655 [Candidatus Aminicenantes bacterium]|nr:hypothetical protein [Candidatus Aminicenantes bacterium]
MTKRMVALSLGFLAAAAAGFSQTWHTGPLDEAIALAKKAKKFLLINFYSPSG